MKKMFLLFSHQLSETQKEQATREFGIEEFITLPKNLQHIWSQIDPELVSLRKVLQPLKTYLQQEANKGDYALIQGDFGAVYLIVNFAKQLGITPVYATTKRYVSEFVNEDGQTIKKSKFEHRRFRKYE